MKMKKFFFFVKTVFSSTADVIGGKKRENKINEILSFIFGIFSNSNNNNKIEGWIAISCNSDIDINLFFISNPALMMQTSNLYLNLLYKWSKSDATLQKI